MINCTFPALNQRHSRRFLIMSPSTATPPSAYAAVCFGPDEGETYRDIKQMCLKLLPSWSSASMDGIVITKISGGISNLIVKVSPSEEDHLAPVAFKIFGEKTELLVDRDQELRTLIKLNAAGFGAQVSCMQACNTIGRQTCGKTF